MEAARKDGVTLALTVGVGTQDSVLAATAAVAVKVDEAARTME